MEMGTYREDVPHLDFFGSMLEDGIESLDRLCNDYLTEIDQEVFEFYTKKREEIKRGVKAMRLVELDEPLYTFM